MNLADFSVSVLLSMSAMLGIHSIPANDPVWQYDSGWKSSNGYWVFEATSTTITKTCRENPENFVNFPAVIHGAHRVWLDNALILEFGDPSFKSVRTFYGAPSLPCSRIAAGNQIVWRVDSYSAYFSRLSAFPTVSTRSLFNVGAESLHLIAAGGALMMALFAATMFAGKTSPQLLWSVTFACLFASIYFGGTVAGFLGITSTMLDTHRFADLGLWISLSCLVNALRTEGLIGHKLFLLFIAHVVVSIAIICAASNGDGIQLGTSIPFGASLLMLCYPLAKIVTTVKESGSDKRRILQALGLATFVFGSINEILVVTGLLDSTPIMPVGFLGGIFLLVLSVNQRINETYIERDYLRTNLQTEVDRKTEELTNKTAELETAMASLKTTQAELVQSAKLASLGTLSAGIAHEINNSLNYVNGALQPLEKIVQKSCREEDRTKIDKLFFVMKDGLVLTLEIIKSLRNYTGLNQAKFNDVNLKSVANSSLTILRNKIRGKIDVQIEVPDNLMIFGSVVGINQIFMNLLSNAIDAMPDGGKLLVEGKQLADNSIELLIRDSGAGMSAETKQRIFEPFFTTKDVGKGTGLGLHIVRTEMERHQGSVEVESQLGSGTSFILKFPNRESVSSIRSAA